MSDGAKIPETKNWFRSVRAHMDALYDYVHIVLRKAVLREQT
jgi:hypothetical protein